MLKTWSFSRIQVFEQCPYRAKLAYIDRLPEPPRPAGKEHPLDRGTRVHESAERFVRGQTDQLTHECADFEPEFVKLRQLFREKMVTLEGDWGFDRDWSPTGWSAPNVWGRMKLDAFVKLSKTHAVVIDYKTGRMSGNEVKHADQGQQYQLGAFMRNPDIELITVEFWYLDQNDMSQMTFTRDQGLRFFKNVNDRALKMTEALDFPPKPNAFNCKWCPYGPKGTGACTHGVDIDNGSYNTANKRRQADGMG